MKFHPHPIGWLLPHLRGLICALPASPSSREDTLTIGSLFALFTTYLVYQATASDE